MVHICKRCKHANPGEAIYCFHDGVLLGHRTGGDIPVDGGAINIGVRPFTVPCVFPSGEECHNMQQLAEACHKAPAVAWEMLCEGHLETFLAGQGRTDLARAARAAVKAADKERGLDDFLDRLPFRLPPAKLRVEPAELDLGTARVGEDRRLELVLRNEGERLLYGEAVSDAPWLSFSGSIAQPSKMFQSADRVVLPIHVLGRNLRAFHKPQESEIRLSSSGGPAAIVVRVQVLVQPFPTGVLAGARSPRELAKKAHDAPKEAAALIESGAVAYWYAANGWTYPVRGPAASGVAAVQQLFEALGLVKPPRVELSEETIRLTGRVGQKVEHTLAVITQENRPVFAHGTSDQTWLEVGRPIFRGRSTFLPLTVAAVPAHTGETLQAIVSITANGGQRFAVPVALVVSGTRSAPRKETGHPAPSLPAARQASVPVATFAPVSANSDVIPTAAPPGRACRLPSPRGCSCGSTS
jgi:hypothetical protein